MDERQKQVLFLKRLRDTADTAAKNGNMISEEELEEAFADLDLNEDQMTQVRDFLKAFLPSRVVSPKGKTISFS